MAIWRIILFLVFVKEESFRIPNFELVSKDTTIVQIFEKERLLKPLDLTKLPDLEFKSPKHFSFVTATNKDILMMLPISTDFNHAFFDEDPNSLTVVNSADESSSRGNSITLRCSDITAPCLIC